MENINTLIAYYSWGGNTKLIAEKIHSQIGGDMFRIETKIPYPDDYNETAYGPAKEQHEKGILPELKETIDITKYDRIFIGTPVWWYEPAPAVKSFLASNNFEGKTIIPFITHGGGGKYTIADEMYKLVEHANVLEPFVVYEKGSITTDLDLTEWLKRV